MNSTGTLFYGTLSGNIILARKYNNGVIISLLLKYQHQELLCDLWDIFGPRFLRTRTLLKQSLLSQFVGYDFDTDTLH